jgi:hypothetical protein
MMFSVCLFGMNFFHSSNGTVSGWPYCITPKKPAGMF